MVLASSIADFAWQSPLSVYSRQPIRRKSVWIADCKCKYCYAGLSFEPVKPPEWFAAFQTKVFKAVGVESLGLNCCNVNYYADGSHLLDWHADDEPLFGDSSTVDVPILSFSVGATRTFLVKHNASSSTCNIVLENGDFCFMGGRMQWTHKHKIPSDRHVSEPRINFTWRRIISHTC